MTGATGYIGSHILRHLLDEGWSVSIIAQPEFGYVNIEDVRDRITIFEYNCDINALIEFFKLKNADVVFHLAAAIITNYKPEQIPTLIQSNVQFGTEILEAMKLSKTKLFVGTGSYWQNYKSDTYSPVDLYAASKEAFEKVLQYYVDAHEVRAITLRLFDVYGEDDKRPKLLNLLKHIAGTERSIDISPGEQLLDMVHISDVSTAYLCAYEWLVNNPNINNEVYSICTGNLINLKEMIALFEQILGKTIHANIGGKPYNTREVMVPMEKYNNLPNWNAKVILNDGLSRFL